MATPLTDGSILLVTLQCKQNNQLILNTLHYEYDKPGGAPDYTVPCTELINLFQVVGDLQSKVQAITVSTYQLVQWIVQPVYPDRLAPVVKPLGIFGNNSSPPAPQNVAAVVSKLSPIATRYGRGSWHQGGLASTDSVGGNITGAVVPLLNNVGQLISQERTLLTSGLAHPILWNKKVPGRKVIIDNYRTETTSRVMRRRTVGVGK